MTKEELKKLSDAATGGTWQVEDHPYMWNGGGIDTVEGNCIVVTGPDGTFCHDEDKAFIVAAVNYVREEVLK